MIRILNAISLLLVAFLIAIQRDELGEALITGHKGLFLAMVLAVMWGLWNIWEFINDYASDEFDDD